MKIAILVENSALCDKYECDHGLSVYFETDNHKAVVDLGPDDKSLKNAEKMGIDLKKVDSVILSHGHYDHSGGIMPFYELNPNARIYIRSNAAEDYYHGERYIGIDKRIKNLPSTVLTDGDTVIDGELSLFTDIRGRRFWPEGNKLLSKKINGKLVTDDFSHEQCLVINSDKKVLISGCAHNGILNILDRYREIYGGLPDAVISGFHMKKDGEYTKSETETVVNTAKELAELPTVFYTGHCTGDAYPILESIMKNNLHKISSGMIFEI